MSRRNGGRYGLAVPIHIVGSRRGTPIEWNTRWHRKHRDDVGVGRSVSWWLALLFTVGSVLFVVGGVATIASADRPAAWLNLIGSIAFSGGAVLAVVEAADAALRLGVKRTLGGLWSTAGGRASLVQVVSAAVPFQIAMIVATISDLGWVTTDVWLWTPSTVGSIGFVIAGIIYLHEARPAADIGTRAAAANLAGSGCFLVGSLAGYLAQGPIEIPGNDFANPVFLAGSLLFLAGSVLGFVELRRPLDSHQTGPLAGAGALGSAPRWGDRF